MAVLDTFSLAGKVSVVTGANRGIGRALVTALAEAGSDVVLLVRDADAGARTKAEVAGVASGAVASSVVPPPAAENVQLENAAMPATAWTVVAPAQSNAPPPAFVAGVRVTGRVLYGPAARI